jgi:NAD(P)-dependent dehydrogenase (short-subunit alcohol dehydrogenase family)
MSLNGGVALVVGGSGDIGRRIAVDLLSAGAEVFMMGRSAARLAEPPPPEHVKHKCRFLAADLTDSDAIARVGAAIASKRRLDILVLSAGTYQRSNEPEVFARQIAANLVGPYALIQQVLPLLIEVKGQIVFINSTQALKATAHVGQYAATKHGLKAIADSLRDEVNAKGVRVMSLFLGRTASARQRAIFATEGRPYPRERLIQLADISEVVLTLLQLPRTTEVTDIVLRPMQKAY